jgi:hypothetical protein
MNYFAWNTDLSSSTLWAIVLIRKTQKGRSHYHTWIISLGCAACDTVTTQFCLIDCTKWACIYVHWFFAFPLFLLFCINNLCAVIRAMKFCSPCFRFCIVLVINLIMFASYAKVTDQRMRWFLFSHCVKEQEDHFCFNLDRIYMTNI